MLQIDAEIMAQNRNPRWRPEILFLSTGIPCAADFPSLLQIWHKNVDRRRNGVVQHFDKSTS